MKDFTNTQTVYTKRLKTVLLKRDLEYLPDPPGENPSADEPEEVYALLTEIFERLDDDQEHLVLLILNAAADIEGYKVLASGGQSSAATDTKLVFSSALMLGASKIILAHNHPSGSRRPSVADIAFTEKMITAGEAIDIPVVDHVIYTHRGCLSMRDEGVCGEWGEELAC